MASHKTLTWALLLLSGIIAGPASVSAEDGYPTREVRMIVPFSAGGGTDLVTRRFAQKLSEKLGKNFFVENRAGGAGGSVGSLELSRAKPDGYTVGTGTSSGIQNAAIDPTAYNPLRDLDPVARYGATTLVLAIDPKIPAKSVAELIAYGKANSGLTYGSSGVGSTNHIAGEKLAYDAKVKMTHVPYRGEGAALTDIIAGRVSFIFVSLAASKSFIDSGLLRPLAISSNHRWPQLPDTPTMAEAGFKDFEMDAWYGLYVPKGTPENLVALLAKNVNEIRADQSVATDLMQQLSFDTSGSDDPKTFRAYMEKELDRYGTIATMAGLKQK